MGQDISSQLAAQIKTAAEEKKTLYIKGSGSKHFYGNPSTIKHDILETRPHNGIVNYQPSELVITVRGGTPLSEIEAELKKNNQCLAFEPPHFGAEATIGGTIASGLSGPARPFKGASRDAVLGCRIINGRGEILRFGGEVVKNVAGYDVSRLITGSLGTLGLLLDISIKVMPLALIQKTFIQTIDTNDAVNIMNKIRRSTLPLSGMAYFNNTLYVRVEGLKSSLANVHTTLGSNTLDNSADFWESLKEQTHPFFQQNNNLWQYLVPPATSNSYLLNNGFIDWAGGTYWLANNKSRDETQALINEPNGHAILFRRDDNEMNSTFPKLTPEMLSLHKRMKLAFDPHLIFNPGRMYSDI